MFCRTETPYHAFCNDLLLQTVMRPPEDGCPNLGRPEARRRRSTRAQISGKRRLGRRGGSAVGADPDELHPVSLDGEAGDLAEIRQYVGVEPAR
jgi:hypothetical protein